MGGRAAAPGGRSLAHIVIMGAAAVMELQLACFAVGAVILWEICKRKK